MGRGVVAWHQIDPRTSRFIGPWDLLTTCALLFTTTFTPYEVAFFPPSSSRTIDALWVVNRVVDAIFLFDILVQFNLVIEKTSDSIATSTTFIISPRKIALTYLRGWFVIDFVSVAVLLFDFVDTDESSAGGGGGGGSLSKLKILRMMRVLRLVKLVRLLRMSRMIKRWEARFAVDYAMLSLFKSLATAVVMAHWMACMWTLQAHLQDDLDQTWLGTTGLCVSYNASDASASTTGVVFGTHECMLPGIVYSTSLYFTVMTITSVGYGDISATAYNSTEMLWCTLLMYMSCIVFAQLLGTFCGVIANFYPEANQFRQTMNDLNRFMKREGFQADLRLRLRKYFHQAKALQIAASSRKLLEAMPPSLQGEVAYATYAGYLSRVKILSDATPRFMIELSMLFHPVIFAPGDIAPRGNMYIVQRGIAVYRGRILTKGMVWGDDMIMETARLRYRSTARAMHYLEAFFISRDEMAALCKRHPDTQRTIRSHANWMALRREIVSLAQRARNEAEGGDMGRVVLTMMELMSVDASDGGHILEDSFVQQAGRVFDPGRNEYVEIGAGDGTLTSAGGTVDGQLDILRVDLKDEREAAASRAVEAAKLHESTAARVGRLEVALAQLATQVQARDAVAAQREARLHSMLDAIGKALNVPTTAAASTPLPGADQEDRLQDGVFTYAKDSPPLRGAGSLHHLRRKRTKSKANAGGGSSNPLEA